MLTSWSNSAAAHVGVRLRLWSCRHLITRAEPGCTSLQYCFLSSWQALARISSKRMSREARLILRCTCNKGAYHKTGGESGPCGWCKRMSRAVRSTTHLAVDLHRRQQMAGYLRQGKLRAALCVCVRMHQGCKQLSRATRTTHMQLLASLRFSNDNDTLSPVPYSNDTAVASTWSLQAWLCSSSLNCCKHLRALLRLGSSSSISFRLVLQVDTRSSSQASCTNTNREGTPLD